MNIEWKILEFFDSMKNTFFDYFNYFVSSILGSLFLIILFFIIYWLYDKDKGLIVGYTLISSFLINNFIKGLVKRTRPFEREGHEHLRKLTNYSLNDGATGTSFPSGHSQNSAALYSSVCLQYNAKRLLVLRIILIAFIIIVGISRIYLGVHFPSDVLTGIIIGVAITFLAAFLQDMLGEKKWLLYFATLIIFTPCLFFKKDDGTFQFGRDFLKSYGMILGFASGAFFEEKNVNFGCNASKIQKLLRFLIGIIIIGLIYLIYNIVPENIHNNGVFTVAIHFLIAFLGIYIVPLIFTKVEGAMNKKHTLK